MSLLSSLSSSAGNFVAAFHQFTSTEQGKQFHDAKGTFRKLALELLERGVNPEELKIVVGTGRGRKKIDELVNKGFAKEGLGNWIKGEIIQVNTAATTIVKLEDDGIKESETFQGLRAAKKEYKKMLKELKKDPTITSDNVLRTLVQVGIEEEKAKKIAKKFTRM